MSDVSEKTVLEPSNNTHSEAPAVTNSQPANFVETLNEDLRGVSNLGDFADVNQLAKSYVELQRMVGNSVRIPPADASDESKQDFFKKIRDLDGVIIKGDKDFYQKIGRPEDFDKYQLDDMASDDFKTKHAIDIENFKKSAFDLGLTNEQARTAAAKHLSLIEQQEKLAEEGRVRAEQELKKSWGSDYENRLNAAKQTASILREKYGDSIDSLINSDAGNNPAFIRILSEIGETYKERSHIGTSGMQFNITPEMAAQKIADKRADSGFMRAYHDNMDPGHSKAISDMSKLYSIAHGSE